MCCITSYVIKHFYGEGCKCSGLIPHCAHSAAHFVYVVCEGVCVSGEGLVSRPSDPEWGGAAALTNCLCSHLGSGLFRVNKFVPFKSCKHFFYLMCASLLLEVFPLRHFIIMRDLLCCTDKWYIYGSLKLAWRGVFQCFVSCVRASWGA